MGDKKQYLSFIIVALIIFSVMFFFKESSDETKLEPTDSFLSNGVEMVGIEEKLGLFPGKGLIENERSRQMWHFWGDIDYFRTKNFDIKATHEKTGEVIDLFFINTSDGIGSPNNGADAHTPSVVEFPQSGIWKLDIYHGEELFESILLEVETND
ncbi:DUF4871 domain-containing protein [Evansella clarkii]|uniref:DUF4871 domain-containing protein n=1 Tax=Evansella clarkii TaxID=79879 RepID=UPI000B440A97|nr:DUF4871 domain-containing protein [Evansella clarkii]